MNYVGPCFVLSPLWFEYHIQKVQCSAEILILVTVLNTILLVPVIGKASKQGFVVVVLVLFLGPDPDPRPVPYQIPTIYKMS